MVRLVGGLCLNPLSQKWYRGKLRLWHWWLQFGPVKWDFFMSGETELDEEASSGKHRSLQLVMWKSLDRRLLCA